MKKGLVRKGLVISVILIFIGVGIQPAIATVQQEEELIDVEPKDYLFQTILDIANNPDVKELLEQYDNDLFKVDIDRSVYRKLLLRNPRLLINILFTKPSISVEYLNNCYNNGIEITSILGEDKVLEIIENVKVTDTKLFDKLNNIVTKDEVLSGKLDTLKEVNKVLNPITPFEDNPIICTILLLLVISSWIVMGFFEIIINIIDVILNENSLLREILSNLFLIIAFPSATVWFCSIVFMIDFCLDFYPYIKVNKYA